MPSPDTKLGALNSDRSDAMLRIVRFFQDMRDFAHKRLTTTVEEDKSVQEHFEDVKIREEKALSEKSQLQQKLKLDRLQRQRQVCHSFFFGLICLCTLFVYSLFTHLYFVGTVECGDRARRTFVTGVRPHGTLLA